MFAELSSTTNFTFLTGASHPEEMVMRAAELGLDAIAITDRNSLAGVVRAHVRLKELRRERVTVKPRNITGSDVRAHAARVNAIRSQVRIDPSSRQPDLAPGARLLRDGPEPSGTAARDPDLQAGPPGGPRSDPGQPGVDGEDSTEPEIRSIPNLLIGARLVLSDSPVELIALVTDRPAYGRLCRLLTTGKRRAVKGQCDLRLADVAEWAEGLVLVAVLPDVLGDSVDPSALAHSRKPEVERDQSRYARSSDRPRAEAKRPPGGAVGRCPAAPGGANGQLKHAISMLGSQLKHLALAPRYDGRDTERFAHLAAIAEAHNLTPVATCQPMMHRGNRRKLADILTCLREGCTVDTLGTRALPNAEQHLRGPEAMARIFAEHPGAIASAGEIAGRCTFSLDELRYEYPDEGNGETPQDRLARLAAEGLDWRYPDGVPQRSQDLVDWELALIGKLNYAPYFLTVRDVVHFARSRGILCQGRGSAANSTVCYALGITEIAPDTISMVFERFVSEARDEPPDIDVDFEHERREEVIQHIYQTYGRERAGLTATVIHFRSRAAIREVGKAMGLSEDVTSALSGQVWGWSQEAIRAERLREVGLDPGDRRLQQTLALVEQIIGFPRHLSQHVGGFVITAGRLDELCPIENAAMDDRTVIEWDKDDIDALGILKVDVLALGMLTCIRKAFDLLRSHCGEDYTLATLPPECPEVYDMLCKADSLGVFQVESRAQMNFLPRMRPRNFYDLVIEVAIIRPGPIQGDMVHPYIRRRQGEEPVSFPSDELGEVLGKTLGVPLFQEQAMRIAIVAAGFTPDEADRLRRSLATFRKTGTISSFRERFIGGMLERGYEHDFAERCFSQIEGFGEYGFPESHAASFALLVYASAWLKRHHPAVFACALLNSQPMGFYAPAQIVRDAREHGVVVRPVCINASCWDNTLEPDGQGGLALRLGFRQIKGIKEEDGHWISAARGNGYPDIESLWRRAGIARRALEKLANADAFAESGLARRHALWEAQGTSGAVPLPLFAEGGEGLKEDVPDLPVPSLGEEVVEDYRALRLSLRAHPLAILRPDL
ncbi:MAG: error-prone DNA polymerase [Pseudomonadota bacterium]